jgi:hypothetical protein
MVAIEQTRKGLHSFPNVIQHTIERASVPSFDRQHSEGKGCRNTEGLLSVIESEDVKQEIHSNLKPNCHHADFAACGIWTHAQMAQRKVFYASGVLSYSISQLSTKHAFNCRRQQCRICAYGSLVGQHTRWREESEGKMDRPDPTRGF